ncbi:MAG: MgtC/SapB family protein [Candidatus Omnitrophica bacterium]|nr:MgtC/SapB family protein [Candidatus Omnitrophota bacterium]MBU2044256.1 MgtC/SapB family protein [Candidatus Omnitrophota bacterium]MBU2251518.1 MgtC/SapB family protein [Candidatus Omnitrophota bacterium]MBU2266077.1 MgtC/SapB family protein [Candidatus Omnitrophota bacterium]MBU2474067.1 MgtC/SapB family protein [Candidatus Omnitrophota bacterium]
MIDTFTTIFRLVLAFCLCSVIGFERERKGGSAGLRTHILVGTGSTLIMLVSLYIFQMYHDQVAVDPGRIAAGVVTGIGFLGAGTIIRSREGVKGLTTAASVWVSSGIGLAIGCGYISAALATTAIAYLSLSFLKKLEKTNE